MATEKNTSIKVGKQFRYFSVERSAINTDKRTVELAFSSEEPVERYWGIEILDHNAESVNLRRLKRGGALLIDHDMRNQVGVIEEVTIGADRKGRAVVRFGRSAKAEEIFQDVVDGIRSNVSVGYQLERAVLEEERKDGPNTYRVTRWEPFEISLVAVPADITVGVGREAASDTREITIERKKEIRTMEKCAKCGTELVNGKCSECEARAAAAASQTRTVEVTTQSPAPAGAVEMEKARQRAIAKLCEMNKLSDEYRQMWIGQGTSVEQVADEMLKIMEERGRTNPQPLSKIGLSGNETRQYSLVNAILATVDKDWSRAGFELECSRAVASKLGRIAEPTKFYVPFEALERPIAKRDLSTTSVGVGGALVQTDNIGFIEMLRNRAVVFKMGARRLSGLVGNVTIPRMSVAGTATWLANQASTIDESTQTFVQVSLSPKNVGAYTEISRQLLLQSSPGVEGIVSDDLAQTVATAADYACLAGSGSNGEPDGLIDYTGIGSVTGTSLAYAGILEFQTDVATSNVMPVAGGYVTTPAVAALLMARQRFTSTDTPLWDGNVWDGRMAGFPAMSSNQMPAADMIFGDWQELVVGEWGVLEIEVNPYANFQAGIIGVRAIYTMDAAPRRPFAFSQAKSIT